MIQLKKKSICQKKGVRKAAHFAVQYYQLHVQSTLSKQQLQIGPQSINTCTNTRHSQLKKIHLIHRYSCLFEMCPSNTESIKCLLRFVLFIQLVSRFNISCSVYKTFVEKYLYYIPQSVSNNKMIDTLPQSEGKMVSPEHTVTMAARRVH